MKISSKEHHFSKITIITKTFFSPDNDACNVTNPLDLINWSKENALEIIYWSSQSVYKSGLINFLEKGFLKIFLGSSFLFLENNYEFF